MVFESLRVHIFVYRLEEESNTNQKLSHERTVAENKIKGLEEQITVNEDNISKVLYLLFC